MLVVHLNSLTMNAKFRIFRADQSYMPVQVADPSTLGHLMLLPLHTDISYWRAFVVAHLQSLLDLSWCTIARLSIPIFSSPQLIGLRPSLEGLHAFGTDGEKALADGFAHEFRYAIHLTCFNHFRRNIKQQLQERGFPSHAIVEIIDDVMGCQKGSVFCEGLVDCRNHEEFQQKLLMLKERWGQFEDQDGQDFYECMVL